LGANLLLAVAFSSTVEPTYAQLVVLKPTHVWHVHGYVTNKSGKPIADAEVTLVAESQPWSSNEESLAFKTKTDSSGRFKFDHAAGQYWFRVKASHYSTASQQVIIGADLATLFHRSIFYVMLGPSACSDECSPIYTTKKKFDQAVRWNTGHYY
jgi:hypothetical protein